MTILYAFQQSYNAKRKYERYYNELDYTFQSNASEDYLYTKINANYSISLKDKSSITFSLHEYFRNSPYIYNLNFHKHFYSQNIDKNLHLKYIYSPDSDINQKLYIQKSKEENNKDYYINSFSYKRKNKIF